MEENAKVVHQNEDAATAPQEAVEKVEDLAASTQNDTDAVDYKTLYEEELERVQKLSEERDNYKQGLLNEKDINKKKIVTTEPDIKDDDVDLFIATRVQEEVMKHLKPLQEQTLSTELSKISSDPYEQKMIKHYYDTGIMKTGDMGTDLKRARALVRDSVMEKKSKEIKRAQENNAHVADIGSSSSSSQEESVNDSFWTKEQESAIRAKGLDPETVKKNFLQG